MKTIPVASKVHGVHYALIDDEDFELISRYKWFLCAKTDGRRYSEGYLNRKQPLIRMHRLIMGVDDPKVHIDHKDHNGLNNQKENLRIATLSQNGWNTSKYSNNTTGFKGVIYIKLKQNYVVRIMANRKQIHGGTFLNAVDAAKRWNELSRQYHGEFAYQNPV